MTIVTRASTLRASSVIFVCFMGISDESVERDVRGVPVQVEPPKRDREVKVNRSSYPKISRR
jgi:hypothetical protein